MNLETLWKGAYELAKRSQNVELREQLLELREAVLAVKSENLELRAQLEELKRRESLKTRLRFDGHAYWQQPIEEGTPEDGPYCQLCWDAEEKLIRLQMREQGSSWWSCFRCERPVDLGANKGHVPIQQGIPLVGRPPRR